MPSENYYVTSFDTKMKNFCIGDHWGKNLVKRYEISPIIMYHPSLTFQPTDEPAKANTSDLNEELGQVQEMNLYFIEYFFRTMSLSSSTNK